MIKIDIEMPKSCVGCNLAWFDASKGNWLCIAKQPDDMRVSMSYTFRPKNCPLRECKE